MANHPNRTRTYWYSSPRNFANEYSIGIATTREQAKSYEDGGYTRIDRERALRELTYSGDNATQVYASVSVDGDDRYDRREVAKAIRSGAKLIRTY